MNTGQIDILNTGEGHMEIKLNEDDPISMERAKRIITDMIKRGYALFVHGKNNVLCRVKRFDPKKMVYIIGDGPEIPTEAIPAEETKAEKVDRQKGYRQVPASRAKVTVVGRSAGG